MNDGKNNLVVYCVDVGSEKHRDSHLGWVNNCGDKNTTMQSLFDDIKNRIEKKINKIAIGFECPLFYELQGNSKEVTNARYGIDGNRAMTASPGACSHVTGATQILWLFNKLKEYIKNYKITSLNDWDQLTDNEKGIYVWEAFISNKKKTVDKKKRHDIEDAQKGLEKFLKELSNPTTTPTLLTEKPQYFSVIESIILSIDDRFKEQLSTKCFVIKI